MIYNLGSLNIDHVYSVDHFAAAGETLSSQHMQVFPGGKGLNQSVALAKAGASVTHGAVIGEGGEFLLDTLTDAGVQTAKIEKTDCSCGHAIIQVDKTGQNCILLFAGSNHRVKRDYIARFLADAQAGDVLLLQNEVSGLDAAFELAQQKKMRIALNPSPYHDELKKLPLSCVKWFFCNEVEGEALLGSADPQIMAENFRKQYPHSDLVLTLGKKGSLFINADRQLQQPIYPVQTVDTTAAGDTFLGYFLAAVTGRQDEAAALDIAAKASAIAVSRPGASASIPSWQEVVDQRK